MKNVIIILAGFLYLFCSCNSSSDSLTLVNDDDLMNYILTEQHVVVLFSKYYK